MSWRAAVALAGVSALSLSPALAAGADASPATTTATATLTPSIITFGQSTSQVSSLVNKLIGSGFIHKQFQSIPGVEADLSPAAINLLESLGAVVTADASVPLASTTANATCPASGSPSTPTGNFPTDTGAAQLAASTGDEGQGVTVAVLDTGIDASLPDFGGRVIGGVDLTGGNSPYTDQYGHGTFVAGLVAGNGASSNGQYVGEAPDADLVSIKVAGATGATNVSTIIQGIDWAIANRAQYGIKVLNLSLGMEPTGPTATEPMDMAVQSAWNAGITVVISAGNNGPVNGTIDTPGDDPLAITVGAYADNDSTAPANWAMCPFSSVGPTMYDGWFKPDIAAPGRSDVSLLDPGSTVATENPSAVIGTGNFVGSGTSFSAAITSGAAALVLSAHPSATPNQVKGRLLGDAMPGPTGNPFVEGHGLLNVLYATTGPTMTLNQVAPTAPTTGGLGGLLGGLLGGAPSFPTVNLGTTWAGSSWNGALWSGSSWNGSSWNGSSWNGGSWTGSSWNGSSWNGSSWNGSSWNGSSWNGGSWTGSSWNGSSWNGSSWNGSSWNGASWNGGSWTGSSWNGSSWNGSSWNGSSWNGEEWD